jgi:rhodanese-related sulfurtransferase
MARVYTCALSGRPRCRSFRAVSGFYMELFIQFAIAKWYLFGAGLMLLALLVFHERRKDAPGLSPAQLVSLVNQKDAVVLDVRDTAEYRQGHIVNSNNIPHGKLGERLAEIESWRERPLVVVCKMGHHSGAVARTLREKGFTEVYRLQGGMLEWQSAQLPQVR